MRYVLPSILLFIILITGMIITLVLAPIGLQELRDVVLIVYGVMGVLLLIALICTAFLLWGTLRVLVRTLNDLVRTLNEMLEDPVRPTLEELRTTARNVRGTSEFVTDAAVHPLIRVISVSRGIRRGASRLTRFARRQR